MKLKDGSIFKSIFTMGAGTLLAQSINVLVQPILTRTVPAETLGMYTFLISLATMIIPVASLKIDMLIVSEANDHFAQYITDTCIVICSVISVIYFAVIGVSFLFPTQNVFNKYGKLIFIVPFIVFTNGIRFLFISYNNRYKQYKKIAGVGLIREGARAVIQVGSGVLQFGVFGQVLGYVLAPVFGFSIQSKEYFQKLKRRHFANPDEIKTVLAKGRNQIFYLVPGQFINSFSGSLITICITSLYNAETLGYYSAGNRILEIPIIFIAANVSKVCYMEISERVAKKQPVFPVLTRIVFGLSIVSVLGFGLLFFIAPQISEIVFGKGYYTAGIYIKCLCLMYAVRLVSTSFAGIYTVFKKQYYEFLLNIFLVVVAAVIYIIAKSTGLQMESYLWLICLGYTIMYVIMLVGYIILCRNHDKTVAVQ